MKVAHSLIQSNEGALKSQTDETKEWKSKYTQMEYQHRLKDSQIRELTEKVRISISDRESFLAERNRQKDAEEVWEREREVLESSRRQTESELHAYKIKLSELKESKQVLRDCATILL